MKLVFCVKFWSSKIEYCKVQYSGAWIYLNLGYGNVTNWRLFYLYKCLLFTKSMTGMTPFVWRFSNKLCQLFIIPNIMKINLTITNIWTEVMLVSGWIYAQNTASVRAHAYSESQMEGPVAGEISGANRDLGAGQVRQRGGCWMCDMAEDAGPRRRAQRRVEKAG